MAPYCKVVDNIVQIDDIKKRSANIEYMAYRYAHKPGLWFIKYDNWLGNPHHKMNSMDYYPGA